jgi:hypothetical protein
MASFAVIPNARYSQYIISKLYILLLFLKSFIFIMNYSALKSVQNCTDESVTDHPEISVIKNISVNSVFIITTCKSFNDNAYITNTAMAALT